MAVGRARPRIAAGSRQAGGRPRRWRVGAARRPVPRLDAASAVASGGGVGRGRAAAASVDVASESAATASRSSTGRSATVAAASSGRHAGRPALDRRLGERSRRPRPGGWRPRPRARAGGSRGGPRGRAAPAAPASAGARRPRRVFAADPRQEPVPRAWARRACARTIASGSIAVTPGSDGSVARRPARVAPHDGQVARTRRWHVRGAPRADGGVGPRPSGSVSSTMAEMLPRRDQRPEYPISPGGARTARATGRVTPTRSWPAAWS